jgi:hypothetical protein
MDNINFNNILERNSIEYSIEKLLCKIINNEESKKGIYIHGEYGIGKTQFILNLLKKNNYDILYYDSISIKNKNVIQNISNNNLSTNNVYNLFYNNNKKIVVVIDDINSFNNGDKTILTNLIKLVREKKTKKQKLEQSTNNPIICINTLNNDKKILELMNVCNVFKLKKPENQELIEIINIIIPEFKLFEKSLINNILDFLNNKLYGLNKLYFYYKNNLLKEIFINNNNSDNYNINCIKSNTKLLLENKLNIKNINYILESNRTIVSLLFHENLIKLLNISVEDYLQILENYIYSDYIDRIIFQKQVWQLIEINYIIKIFYSNFLLNKFNLLNKNIAYENIIFTKILTKYSSEYNNFIFIYNLLQLFLIDKKDLLLLMNNQDVNNINEISEKFHFLNITKLEIIRINKFIKSINNYNNKIEKDNVEEYILNDFIYNEIINSEE